MSLRPPPVSAVLILLLVPSLLVSCSDECTTCPNDLGDWPVASPSSQGLNAGLLEDVTDELAAGNLGLVSSMLIVRHGHLVYEEYFLGMSSEELHNCYSVTKSFASALIGIARESGAIGAMGTPLLDFFPEYPLVANDGEWKRAITLEHALQMRTGIEWDEWSVNYSTPSNPVAALYGSDDWIKHMLDQEMGSEPGADFVYNTGVSLLLSGVLQNRIGMSAETFAQMVLFDPMAIHQWDWYTGPNGVTDTGGGLLLRPRDMAKFGYLYLHEGVWEPTGERLIPAAWVDVSTQRYTVWESGGGYGYQWWITSAEVNGETIRFPYAVGWGGQRIYVVPQLDMVVVMTAEGFNDEPSYRTEILFDYVFPSADPAWASAQVAMPDMEFVGR